MDDGGSTEKHLAVAPAKENKGGEREGLVDFAFVNILFSLVSLSSVFMCVV